MNVRLLRKVAKHISEEPRRFVMGSWRLTLKEAPTVLDHGGHEHGFPACGTAACIGGWTVILGEPGTRITQRSNFEKRARKLLALDAAQGERLFDLFSWPEHFEESFRSAQEPKERVKIAVARIEHFITTKGKE